MIGLIDEARNAGARLSKAADTVGLTCRTIQRWRQEGEVKGDARGKAASKRTPRNKLTEEERENILNVVNAAEFADKPPSQIVPILADRGQYLASESTIYRIMRESRQLAHRGKAKRPSRKRPEPLQADAPNQLWSWDITYLASNVKGVFYYLYLFMDVYSRKIVGWEVYEEQSADHAANLIHKTCLREGTIENELTLHSDNGSPMKGATMLATLQQLGVMPSFSRPSVSDDNPYSESLFKTLKYHPGFPDKPFASLDEARIWVAEFVQWYNEDHHHSSLNFVTPGQRHGGEDAKILKKRHAVYKAARSRTPERWARNTRNWSPVGMVYLNPGKPAKKEEQTKQKTA